MIRCTLTVLLVPLAIGCTDPIERIELPWKPAKTVPTPGKSKQPTARDVVDCDDLPQLTPEEEAAPPNEVRPFEPRLQKSSTGDAKPPNYILLPGVSLSESAAMKLNDLDNVFF